MSQGNFLQGLMEFPKDSINEETVELLMPYFDAEDYTMETAKRVSRMIIIGQLQQIYSNLLKSANFLP